MKIAKLIFYLAISVFSCAIMFVSESNGWTGIAGTVLGLSIPGIRTSFENISDTTKWKESQRKLKRGGYIRDDTIVRISFAYLFRIKTGDKYLLVKNERGTGKFQPVGGVYKFKTGERTVLKRLYHVKDDNKISIDASSRDDYRLRLENKYLRKFVRRFDKKARRERIDNLSREFSEELVKTGIVDWKQIKYRYCGRHMTELKFSEHFQIYEVLLADVVELMPTSEQENDLQQLLLVDSNQYYFATVEEILALGVDTAIGKLTETVANHTRKIIQENEDQLAPNTDVGKIYTVSINA